MDILENYAVVAIPSDKDYIRLQFEVENFSPGGATVQKTAEIFFKYK